MKKLMTMFASAATLCAFGVVNAEGLTSTGFETAGYVAGQNLSTTNDDYGYASGAPSFAETWVDVEPLDDGVAVVTAYGSEGAAAKGDVTPVAGGDDIGDNYLKLDSAPLISRYAQTGGEAYEIPSEGIYIDTLVKFTPSEDTEPETTAGDKLCIWVNVDEETGATNLMVRAGYIEDDTGTTVPTNYVVTGAFQNLDGWHRLTVIAYTSIDEDEWLASGFAIKIDGNLVGTDICPFADASTYIFNENVAAYMASSPYKLFPSLVSQADDDSTSLTSIGFKGSGSIDNLQFTTTNPLPTPSEDDWVDDPEEIPANTTAATQYPALASSALANADAKKLTVWATDNNIDFATVEADTTGTLVDAYLLNCDPAEVEDEKDEFVLSITFDSEGNPRIEAPDGKEYNGTLTIYGSDDLSIPKANWDAKTDGDTFFYGVLSL